MVDQLTRGRVSQSRRMSLCVDLTCAIVYMCRPDLLHIIYVARLFYAPQSRRMYLCVVEGAFDYRGRVVADPGNG